MSAPVFVAGGALLVSAGGLFCFMPLRGAGAGECARRRSNFLLLRQKKVTKEKATPLSASLRFASGNLRCSRPAGSRSNSLHCVALRQSRALIRWPLRSSAHPEGNPRPDIPSGHCFARPSLRSAWRLRPRGVGRAQRWPVWLFGCPAFGLPPLLAAPTAGRLRGGMGAFARMLRYLTRRVCPNAAAQQRSELCGAPRKRPAAGLPRRGRRLQGRLSFGYFSLAKQRTSTSPAGARPGPRP